MAEPKLSGVILDPKSPVGAGGYTSPHRGAVMPGHDMNVKPAPPVGSPERRRIRIVPSSYQPHVAAPMTPPSHAPPTVRGMEDTEFNTRDVVVREGYLMKLKQTHRWANHSRWNKRWFQLRGGFLLYFKRQGMDTPAGWLRVVQIREIKALENDTIIPGAWPLRQRIHDTHSRPLCAWRCFATPWLWQAPTAPARTASPSPSTRGTCTSVPAPSTRRTSG